MVSQGREAEQTQHSSTGGDRRLVTVGPSKPTSMPQAALTSEGFQKAQRPSRAHPSPPCSLGARYNMAARPALRA